MIRESITVTALNQYVKSLLESDEVLSQIWVEGEISTFKLHSASGHMYFRLIDKHCGVKCVMFYSYASKLKFVPKDGMKVIVKCKVSLYEVNGDFQLYVYDMIEKGTGERKEKLELLKEKLIKEGFFDEARKKKLPYFPKSLGIITSDSGAAVQDIINVLTRRDPFVYVMLFPVNVQGLYAVDSICSKISAINNMDDPPDVLIIARGGGSKDNLWIFNEEKLLYAAFELKIPFISAVGHETDYTLLDYLADLRVPTPTAAAELAVPNVSDLYDDKYRMLMQMKSFIIQSIDRSRDIVDNSLSTLDECAVKNIALHRKNLLYLEKMSADLSPLQILKRGYAVVQNGNGLITTVNDTYIGDKVEIELHDGSVRCTVNEVINNGI